MTNIKYDRCENLKYHNTKTGRKPCVAMIESKKGEVPKQGGPGLFPKYCPPNTVPKYCPPNTVPQILYPKYCTSNTVPQILYLKYCPPNTVPQMLSPKYCPHSIRTPTHLVKARSTAALECGKD
jgi:hypothetical protein